MKFRRRRATWLIRVGVLVALAVLFWLVPPFHIVRLKAAQQQQGQRQRQTTGAAFDASAFVETLWNGRLIKSSDRATDAATLLAAIRKDPKAARATYGRGSELASGYYYYITGEGRVTAVTPDGVSLSIGGGAAAVAAVPDIVLETGNIFGNAVRDGTGLIDVSSFANSQDFNAISSEINRRIEERVLPPLRAKATVGATVRFAGCAEVVSDENDVRPLRVVPISAAVP